MVLTEGTDLPVASCILHAKPTKSATLYEQMTGRGLRIHPEDPAGPARKLATDPFIKSDCVVIDLVDVARRHSLQTAPVLYGLPPRLKTKGQELEEMLEEWDELREKHPNLDVDAMFDRGPISLAEFAAQAERVDIWRVPELGRLWRRPPVAVAAPGRRQLPHRLPLAGGPREPHRSQGPARPLGGGALAYRLAGQKHSTSRTIAAQVTSMDAAASLAEGFVATERASVIRMKATDAPWKQNPATPKQLALLRKWNIPHDPRKTTGGQASQLIDLWIARHGRRR